MEPFEVHVPDAVLDDLRRRLRATRWPEREPVDDWSQGVPLDYLQQVCHTWAEDYDWRERERALNRFDQYRTTLSGQGGTAGQAGTAGLAVHLLHVRSPEPDALPLLLTHGWPGTVHEFDEMIGPLTDPAAHGGRREDAFHVVCPSLPGFGFSDRPPGTGWGLQRIAAAWAELAARLGYDRYGAHGGDWGSGVTTVLGSIDPAHCVGIHVTMPLVQPGARPRDRELTAAEQQAVAAARHYRQQESGYQVEQSTRPQTLGYALSDSPAGQAAWILEKYRAWTDGDGHPENALSRQTLLDVVTWYWVTGTAASSARLYWESSHVMTAPPTVDVPAGVAQFPLDLFPQPRSWAQTTYRDLRHWTDMPRGGHFAALEQPALLVEDLRTFFRPLR